MEEAKLDEPGVHTKDNRSSSTKSFMRGIMDIAKGCSQLREKDKSISTIKNTFIRDNKERTRLSRLMSTLQELSVHDPSTVKMLYDIKCHEEREVNDAKRDYRQGVADPIRIYNTKFM